jgi:uncharacterized protein YjlB
MRRQPEQYKIKDNGVFPNSSEPVLHYKGVLRLPTFLASWHVKRLFRKNNWSNNWQHGIYTFHHYHSITHEAMGVCKGATTLLLGGDDGILINIQKGDVIIIPAGVAHKNLGDEDQVVCVGGYPDGKDYDMNYGKAGERPKADQSIAAIPVPGTDPVFGKGKGVATIWKDK